METSIERKSESKDVEKPFNPIEIFRIEAKTLIEKLGKTLFGPVTDRIFNLHLNEDQGMLYFHFSPNLFTRRTEAEFEDDHGNTDLSKIPGIFKLEDKPRFLQFLQQYNENIVTILTRAYYKVKGLSLMVIEDSKGNIQFRYHSMGFLDDNTHDLDHLIEIIVRMLGEKIDRDYGYDPLAELTLCGLSATENCWTSFLLRDVYDPRLLILISQFAFGYTQKEIDNIEKQFEACFVDNHHKRLEYKIPLWTSRWIPKRTLLAAPRRDSEE